MPDIHASAVVDAGADIGPDVAIGPYCVIGPEVEMGEGCHLVSHVTIEGPTTIGSDNGFFPFCSIGMAPQDITYAGEPTRLEIGDHNEIREFVTINRGTVKGGGLTRVGSHTLVMAYTHIAHDCVVGNGTTFSNNAQLAGHVHIGDCVVMGAYSGVHQFCRVGAHAMIAAGAIVLQDVPPFVTAAGYPATPRGINAEGLRRRGFAAADILAVRRAYKTLYREGRTLDDAKEALASAARTSPSLTTLVEFLAAPGRGIVRA
jgi:UDP-N-acetylglucosamine acyltransferase